MVTGDTLIEFRLSPASPPPRRVHDPSTRSARLLRAQQKRPEHVPRIGAHLAVRRTNPPQCIGVARVTKMRRTVAAEQRQRLSSAEPVPELLELARCRVLTPCGENIDHLTVNPDGPPERGQPPHQGSH